MKRIYILIILVLLIIPSIIHAQENQKICAIYFTYIGCPNCAQVDPVVLTEWTKKFDYGFIIVENGVYSIPDPLLKKALINA